VGAAGRPLHETCPVCGDAGFAVHVQRPTVLWVRCTCGLIYKRWTAEVPRPAPPFDPRAAHYSGRWRRRVAKSRYQIRDVLNFVVPGPLLDIGCSLAYTLRAAIDLGMPARGIEYDAEVAAFCREIGYDVQAGTMTSLPFAAGEFQVVTMKHVLEHTHDPGAAVREVRRVLRPGGGLFIAVPDARYGRSVRNPPASRFFEDGDPQTGHCIYYSPATLTRLLVDNGFRVVRVNPQLVHRTAPWPLRVAQVIAYPVHWLVEWLRDAARIRREFWLVAVKEDGPVARPAPDPG
jgi:SAM-dependent methyltransferase